jgi:acyl carrier protein
MTRDEIRDQVTEITCEKLKVDRSKVTEATSFVDDLGADSLDLAELVMDLEDEFDIEIPEDALQNIKTVGDAIAFVEKKKAAE